MSQSAPAFITFPSRALEIKIIEIYLESEYPRKSTQSIYMDHEYSEYETSSGTQLTRLYDCNAADGKFEALEMLFRDCDVPFDRLCTGNEDVPPGIHSFRLPQELATAYDKWRPVNSEGDQYLLSDHLIELLEKATDYDSLQQGLKDLLQTKTHYDCSQLK